MASNTIDLHLNIQNALKQNLKENKKEMSSFNDKLSQSEKLSEKVSQKMGGIGDKLKQSAQSMSRFGLILQRVVPAFSIIFGGGLIVDTFKEVMDLNQAMMDTAHQMGLGAQGVRQLENATYGVVQATGLATDKAQELVTSLANLHVGVENIESLATASGRFSEVTGVSVDAATRLSGELMRTGRLGAEASQQIMLGMMSVQRAVGMSTAEMQQLTETIQETTKLLNQMNKSASEIERFNKGVVQMAGAFASAGVEASEANKFINELLDPSRVEENAFLYSKLGVSMEDAFSGDVNPQELIPHFKELGQELKNMSGPAAASMAKSLGMPLSTLRQMSEIDMAQQQEMMRMMSEEGKSMEEAMAQMQEGQEGAGRTFEDVINRLKGSIQPLISKFLVPTINEFANMIEHMDIEGIINKLQSGFDMVLSVVGKMSNFLKPSMFIAGAIALMVIIKKIRKKFYTMATGVKEDMQTALVGATEMGAEKGSKIFKNKMSQGIKETGRSINKSFSGTMDEKTGAVYKNIQASVDATRTLKREKVAEYRASLQNVQAESSRYQTRIDYLDAQRESGKITARQTREMRKLISAQKDLHKDAQSFNNRREAANARYVKQQENQMKFLSNEQLRNYKREMEQNKAVAEQQAAAATERMEDLNLQNRRIKDRLATLKTQNKFTGEELKEMEELNSWVKKNNNQLEQAKADRLENLKTAREQTVAESKINRLYRARTGMDLETGEGATEIRETRGIFQKLGDRLTSAGRKMGSQVYSGFAKVQNKFAETRERLQDIFTVRNMKKTIGNAVKAGGKGMMKGSLKLGKSMGKMLGPMALLGVVMTALQPIMESLQPVIDQLLGILMKLGNKLFRAIMPAILKIASALIPAIAALVNALLPPLLYVLGVLVEILGKVINAITSMVKAINELPFVGGKLDAVVGTMESISGSLGTAGQELRSVGQEMMKDKLIDETMVENLQGSLKNTADRIENGELTLKSPGAGGAVAGGTTEETTWTPAMLSAGRTGISVESHAKKTRTIEQQQTQAQVETAKATKMTAEATAKMAEEYSKAKEEARQARNTAKGKVNVSNTDTGSILGVAF